MFQKYLKIIYNKRVLFNPTSRGGAFNARPEQKWQFQHLLVILLSRKNLTFPRNLWGCLSYPFGGSKQPKKGFNSIFVVGGDNFRIIKFVFLAFFEAKMTKIDILNPKLIIPDDYQQFWVHFEWFLALFHISDEKWLWSQFKQKVHKNGTFWSQNPF